MIELESRVVEVKKSNIEGAGKGLFAKDDLYQHQIIALYASKLLYIKTMFYFLNNNIFFLLQTITN